MHVRQSAYASSLCDRCESCTIVMLDTHFLYPQLTLEAIKWIR